MVTVVVFEFSVMRCQPLRRALAVFRNTPTPREGKCTN
ncbi:TPA: acetyltransferase [Vibrio cholerae]|nr:acetyltransferase [Vibrio cholerae]